MTEPTDSDGDLLTLERLLQAMMDHEASDLHLAANLEPLFRIDGALRKLDDFREPVSSANIDVLATRLAGAPIADAIPASGALDGALTSRSDGRFRFNVYRRLPGLAIALRRLENRFRTLEELGLPPVLTKWCDLNDGLVLVAGPTGSGKSTTLATLLDRINRSRAAHIITIEDPIEYLHVSLKGRVDQRQIGPHAPDFNSALVASLRQDPDVVLVGEIREQDTIRTAITAAETGHLVFATVHAPDCAGAIQRIVSVFPADEQPGILRQLSMNLRGVLAQHLVPADGPAAATAHPSRTRRPRVALSEVLQITPATANLVARGQFQNLYSFMETGAQHDMQTLEQCLMGWVQSGHLLKATALSYTRNPRVLEQRLARAKTTSTARSQGGRTRPVTPA